LHARIFGIVQGVFFRSNTEDWARSLSLTGWVRNASDGSVEIVAEGEKSKLEKLLELCRKGPPGARVKKITIEWLDYRGEFDGLRTIF